MRCCLVAQPDKEVGAVTDYIKDVPTLRGGPSRPPAVEEQSPKPKVQWLSPM